MKRNDDELLGTLFLGGLLGLLLFGEGAREWLSGGGPVMNTLGVLGLVALLVLLVSIGVCAVTRPRSKPALFWLMGLGLLTIGGVASVYAPSLGRGALLGGAILVAYAVSLARRPVTPAAGHLDGNVLLLTLYLSAAAAAAAPLLFAIMASPALAVGHGLVGPVTRLANDTLALLGRLWTSTATAPPPPVPPETTVPPKAESEPINRWFAEQRRIVEFINNNFGDKWPEPTFGPSYETGSLITFILKKPDTVRVSDLTKLATDIAIALEFDPNRVIVFPDARGFLVQLTKTREEMTPAWFDETYERDLGLLTKPLSIIVGIDWQREPIVADLNDLRPHTMVAGGTGSGKSVWMHSALVQLLLRNSPAELRVLWLDAGFVTQAPYRDLPHLWRPLGETWDAQMSLIEELVVERDRRQQLFMHYSVPDRESYFALDIPERESMPYILCILDEAATYSDESTKKRYEPALKELLRNGRKAGIRVMLGLQRPMADSLGVGVREFLGRRVIFLLEEEDHSKRVLGESDTSAAKLRPGGDGILKVERTIRFQGLFLPDKGRVGEHLWLADYIERIGARWGRNDFVDAAASRARAKEVKAMVGRQHNPSISDRDWFIIRACQAVFVNVADRYEIVARRAEALAALANGVVPEGYPLDMPFLPTEVHDTLRRLFGPDSFRLVREGEWALVRDIVERQLVAVYGANGDAAAKIRPDVDEITNRPRRDP